MISYYQLFIVMGLVVSMNTDSLSQSKETLPKVFYIGEHESEYEKLVQQASTSLLSINDNHLEATLEKWNELLKSFEDYAESKNQSVYGVKIWLNIFWQPDGHIKHIAFYPKPESVNRDYNLVKTLFTDFLNTNYPKIVNSKPFAHFGSIHFPVYGISILPKE